MQARALWAAALVGAAVADAENESQLASYLAFAAVSIAGVVALGALGDLVEARTAAGREGVAIVRALLAVAGLALAVVACAARGPLVVEGSVPAIASTAIGAMLVLLALDLAIAVASSARAARGAEAESGEAEPVEEDRRAA